MFLMFSAMFIMCSYNKLEDDFQSESDPLRAYNDYLENVENISMFKIMVQVYNILFVHVSQIRA